MPNQKDMAEEEFIYAVKAGGQLIGRKPGGSAHEQAAELRAARPVRSRVERLLRIHNDERAYRLGGNGEEAVGARLDRLEKPRWLALHDIVRNAKGTNVDHLVIGPAGVFSLNTKNHPGAKVVVTERSFRVNGYRTNYLPVAVSEARKVAHILERAAGHAISVKPVIVVVGAEFEVRRPPQDVSVIRRRDLPRWFTKLPTALKDADARELMRVANRTATWEPPKVPTGLTLRSWNRPGKKRTYVNDATGKSLGYRDELTGRIHVEDKGDLQAVTEALGSG